MPRAEADPERVGRELEHKRQLLSKLRRAHALERAAALEVDRLTDVVLQAGVPVDAVVKVVDDGRVKVYVHRGVDKRGAIVAAINIARGRVVSVMPRKLRGDRDCDARGRASSNGDLGVAVWRVVIERGAE